LKLLDFHVLDQKKGVYIDGPKRDNIVEYHQKFLHKMIANGFLNKDNASTAEAEQCLPTDLECSSPHQLSYNIS